MDKKKIERILYDHNIAFKDLERALDIVLHFITNRQLILVGGQAIDYALRAKDSKLYEDYQVPDYDVYSPNHYKDAGDLGIILCKVGLPNISVIRGMHVSTMRVRVDFVPVADITYCPENIYKDLPTIKYNGIRIIHPHEQMIDQHRALCYPYEDEPRESIFSRWEKDIRRYNMLIKHYPIEAKIVKPSHTVKVKKDSVRGHCLAGYIAHAYYTGNYKETESEFEFKTHADEIHLITNNYEPLIAQLTKELKKRPIMYNRVLTRFPERTEFKSKPAYFIYNNQDSLLSAKKITNMSTKTEIGLFDRSDIYIVSPQFLFLYYLHYKDYSSYVELMETIAKDDYIDSIMVNTYGSTNINEAQHIYYNLFHNEHERSNIPSNMFPARLRNCVVKGNCPYNSPYFQHDGKKIN